MGIEGAADGEGHGGLHDFLLAVGQGQQPRLCFTAANGQELPVLQVEGGGRVRSQIDQVVDLLIRQLALSVITVGGNARFDNFSNGRHGDLCAGKRKVIEPGD
ncbi:hypothetical protein D3C76_1415490 [compost metagenome]